MASPKFSIIVPCYNVEKYIEKCIYSLENQTMDNYEIILINDGSTDSTLEICKKMANNNDKIIIVDKENEGLSATRNCGIEIAKGEYLVFVDSDDYIECDALDNINNAILGHEDVIITRITEDYGDRVENKDEAISTFFNKETVSTDCAIEWVMCKSQNTWPAVKYIVSRSCIEDNQLRFLVGYLHEDIDWTSRVFSVAKSIGVCIEPWYHHRMFREGSITNRINPNRIIHVFEMGYNLIEGRKSILGKYSKKSQMLVRNRIMMSVYQSLKLYCFLDNENDRNIVCDAIIKYKSILKYAPKLKYKAFFLSMSLIGIKNTLNLFCKVVH